MTPEEIEALVKMEQDRWRIYVATQFEDLRREIESLNSKVRNLLRTAYVIAGTCFGILSSLVPLLWQYFTGGG